ncbi:MAG: hypothetical protein BA861_01115 [Desulfobacterales bacterium S3730MH5]|nr:MAG: hypothetical protein BA861_01115 [Desulfobacterales bacterium S3730MH5]
MFSQPALAGREDDKENIPWSRVQVNLGCYFAALDSSFSLVLESMSIKIQVKDETRLPGLDFDGSIGFGFNGLQAYVKYVRF